MPSNDLLAAVIRDLIFDALFHFALFVARDIKCIGVCFEHTVSVRQYCEVGSQQRSDDLVVAIASFCQLLCVVLYPELAFNEHVGKVFSPSFEFGGDEERISFAAVDGVAHGVDKDQVAGDDLL